MMTEKEAWLMIRDAFQKYAETCEDGYITAAGICHSIDMACCSDSISDGGGTQAGFDFMFEEEDFNMDDAHHPCQAGFCE